MTNLLGRKGTVETVQKQRFMRVEVTTGNCAEGEAYHHDLPINEETPSMLRIVDAVETLYGHEGVEELYIHGVVEEE